MCVFCNIFADRSLYFKDITENNIEEIIVVFQRQSVTNIHSLERLSNVQAKRAKK